MITNPSDMVHLVKIGRTNAQLTIGPLLLAFAIICIPVQAISADPVAFSDLPSKVTWSLFTHESNDGRRPGYTKSMCRLFQLATNQLPFIKTRYIECVAFSEKLHNNIDSIHRQTQLAAASIIEERSEHCEDGSWKAISDSVIIFYEPKSETPKLTSSVFKVYQSDKDRIRFLGDLECPGNCGIEDLESLFFESDCYPVKPKGTAQMPAIVGSLANKISTLYAKSRLPNEAINLSQPFQTKPPVAEPPTAGAVVNSTGARTLPLAERPTLVASPPQTSPQKPALEGSKGHSLAPGLTPLALGGSLPPQGVSPLLTVSLSALWASAAVGVISCATVWALHADPAYNNTPDGKYSGLLGDAGLTSFVLTLVPLSAAIIITPFYMRERQRLKPVHH